MIWNKLSLTQPLNTTEEATRAKNKVLITLLVIISVQTLFFLVFWWISIRSTASLIPTTPTMDGLLFAALIAWIYLSNSRIVSLILVSVSLFGLINTWLFKISLTGSYEPPAMSLLLAATVIYLAIIIFKLHTLHGNDTVRYVRSKWVNVALNATIISTLIAVFVPIIHFRNYTKASTLTDIGGIMAYHDSLDNYGFDFSKSWGIRSVPLQYGNLILEPIYPNTTEQIAKVAIERWSPSSVAPISLYRKEDFLKMVKDEAEKYKEKTGAEINVAELIGPEKSNINAAKVISVHSDGSKRYVYYYFDRVWQRQNSKSAWFFWRVTAYIPKDASNDEAEFQSIIKTFRINGFTVDSESEDNIEEIRESFAYFLVASGMELSDLKLKIISEANKLLQELNPSRSKLLEAFADVSTYKQKESNDTEVSYLETKLMEKYGVCWGSPEGQCKK